MSFMKYIMFFILFCLVSSLTYGDVVREGTLQARSDGSNITVSWITDTEANVARFEIERRVGTSGEFGYIATVNPKGSSLYEFVDHSTLKVMGTLYQYRIKIIFSDETAPKYVGPVTVNHSVSGVKRTWGSIKAMFR